MLEDAWGLRDILQQRSHEGVNLVIPLTFSNLSQTFHDFQDGKIHHLHGRNIAQLVYFRVYSYSQGLV